MKKFLNSKVSKYFFYMLLVVGFYSCNTKRVPITNFKGGVVYDKFDVPAGLFIDVKKDSFFKQIKVYKLDYDLYKIGDTIK
jgi:hypothetical protein